MARTCIFCDERGGSREHLWPAWLNDVLPDYIDTIYTWRGGKGTHTWVSKKPATHKIGAVCSECNNVWMSQLETAAQPLLTPLINGRRQRLTPEAQRVISAWAFKTAVIGEYFDPPTAVISAEARRWLHDHQEPPVDTSVVIGAADARWPGDTQYSDKKLALHPQPGVVSEELMGNAATLLIKHLALQVCWSPLKGTIFGYQAPFDRSLAQIWTPQGTIQWPPGLVLEPPAVGQLIDFWRGDLPPNPPF